MSKEPGWRPAIPTPPGYEIRPPRKYPPWPEGQDFDSLTKKHGRPKGPFELGRVMDYKGDGQYR
jgi:hypothetical protein